MSRRVWNFGNRRTSWYSTIRRSSRRTIRVLTLQTGQRRRSQFVHNSANLAQILADNVPIANDGGAAVDTEIDGLVCIAAGDVAHGCDDEATQSRNVDGRHADDVCCSPNLVLRIDVHDDGVLGVRGRRFRVGGCDYCVVGGWWCRGSVSVVSIVSVVSGAIATLGVSFGDHVVESFE